MIARGVPIAIPFPTTRGLSTRFVGFVFLVILGIMLAEHDLSVVVERKSLHHHVEAVLTIMFASDY